MYIEKAVCKVCATCHSINSKRRGISQECDSSSCDFCFINSSDEFNQFLPQYQSLWKAARHL